MCFVLFLVLSNLAYDSLLSSTSGYRWDPIVRMGPFDQNLIPTCKFYIVLQGSKVVAPILLDSFACTKESPSMATVFMKAMAAMLH